MLKDKKYGGLSILQYRSIHDCRRNEFPSGCVQWPIRWSFVAAFLRQLYVVFIVLEFYVVFLLSSFIHSIDGCFAEK